MGLHLLRSWAALSQPALPVPDGKPLVVVTCGEGEEHTEQVRSAQVPGGVDVVHAVLPGCTWPPRAVPHEPAPPHTPVPEPFPHPFPHPAGPVPPLFALRAQLLRGTARREEGSRSASS